MRERINISVTAGSYDLAKQLAQSFGYPNVTTFAKDILLFAVEHIAAIKERQKQYRPTTIEKEINTMFNDLEQYEATPDPDSKFVRHNNRDPYRDTPKGNGQSSANSKKLARIYESVGEV